MKPFDMSAHSYPPELPISQRVDEIAQTLRTHQVVIVAGETGSGKTTQLPKIALSIGKTHIAHTQPRRLAARTVAERIAEELDVPLGGLVGYQVRFTEQSSADTAIKVMTDGILLNEIHHDRLLRRYDTIIIDEAHERSLNIDFLLGYLKRILPKRPDLSVIITSATIDPEQFSHHFDDAPIIEVSGRTYPVQIRYRPRVVEASPEPGERPRREDDADDDDAEERDLSDAVLDALGELDRESRGDVLVFLSGEQEIRDVAEALEGAVTSGRLNSRTEILRLYGRLSAADQHKVFEPSKLAGVHRRVVLATNVAETSLTVPGITYVIDAGQARISRYSTRSKVQRLPIEAISQASANQRSGRSGRTSPGIAIRLYSNEDFDRRPEYTEPEIVRTNLASVLLQMESLGLGDIEKFPFLTPPDARAVKDGTQTLTELRAIDGGRLTKIGRKLVRLPIDPRLGRMVIEAQQHSVVREVVVVVAGMTVQDVRERPLDHRQEADAAHARFADPTSDFLSLVNLWNYLDDQRRSLSSSAFRRLCKREYLNFLRVREWMDLVRQIEELARPLGIRPGPPRVDPTGIHQSILAGLLSQIGVRSHESSTRRRPSHGAKPHRERVEYLGSRGTKFVIFPGSSLAKKPPEALMSAELVETSSLFARVNAAIDLEWAEPLAGDLVHRSLGEPHWEKSQGAAVAVERVTLFGVPIVEGRRVQYARFDQAHARQLFIVHALVQGEWDSVQAFDRKNRELRHRLQQLEERSRRRDILVDDDSIARFYDARIPADVVSTRSFEGWWKVERRTSPDLLTMTQADLRPEAAPVVDEREYPRSYSTGDQKLSLTYRFEPGAEDDGVTVNIPLPLLPRFSNSEFDDLIPGMRLELTTALIKSLPKQIRKHVVPAADWAVRLTASLDSESAGAAARQTATERIAAAIRRETGLAVTPDDFDLDRVPDHLKPTFRVLDERGRRIASGKRLDELQTTLAGRATASVARVAEAQSDFTERTGATTWDFGTLAPSVEVRHGAGIVRAYPALVDEGRSSVALRLLPTEHDRDAAMRLGLRRLVALSSPSPAAYIREHLTQSEKLLLSAGPYRSLAAAVDDTLLAIAAESVDRALANAPIVSAERFADVAESFADGLVERSFAAVGLVAHVLDAARAADRVISDVHDIRLLSILADARATIDRLVTPSFVSANGLDHVRRFPVYLRAVGARVEAALRNPARERAGSREVETAEALYRDVGGTIPLDPGADARLVDVRWMLEELRVSVFAEQLGTEGSVSVQRIHKRLAS